MRFSTEESESAKLHLGLLQSYHSNCNIHPPSSNSNNQYQRESRRAAFRRTPNPSTDEAYITELAILKTPFIRKSKISQTHKLKRT